jgi:hypothetical protein
MRILYSHGSSALTISLLLLAGCTAAPKPVSHEVAIKWPRWEYRYLDGKDSEHSAEAEKLKQAGWIFVGYNFRHGDIIAIDENSGIAKRMFYGAAQQNIVLCATFRRDFDRPHNHADEATNAATRATMPAVRGAVSGR